MKEKRRGDEVDGERGGERENLSKQSDGGAPQGAVIGPIKINVLSQAGGDSQCGLEERRSSKRNADVGTLHGMLA